MQVATPHCKEGREMQFSFSASVGIIKSSVSMEDGVNKGKCLPPTPSKHIAHGWGIRDTVARESLPLRSPQTTRGHAMETPRLGNWPVLVEEKTQGHSRCPREGSI